MYTKLSRIGQGAYGIVYKAQNTQNKEIVAVKRIKFETREEGIPASAIREIALLKELKHQNIVKLYDVVHSQHTLTLIFEYCDWDLKRLMQSRENPLSENEILSFTYQLLCALQFLQSKCIIHRDVKPQNILINRKMELKLGDFGLARSTFIPVDELSTEVITLWYRPPEICLGCKDYGFPVDIWSAGCVVAEMINGEPLFPYQSNAEMIAAFQYIFGSVRFKEVFPDSEITDVLDITPDGVGVESLIPNASETLKFIVRSLLELDPSKRASVDEMLSNPIFTPFRKESE